MFKVLGVYLMQKPKAVCTMFFYVNVVKYIIFPSFQLPLDKNKSFVLPTFTEKNMAFKLAFNYA